MIVGAVKERSVFFILDYNPNHNGWNSILHFKSCKIEDVLQRQDCYKYEKNLHNPAQNLPRNTTANKPNRHRRFAIVDQVLWPKCSKDIH